MDMRRYCLNIWDDGMKLDMRIVKKYSETDRGVSNVSNYRESDINLHSKLVSVHRWLPKPVCVGLTWELSDT